MEGCIAADGTCACVAEGAVCTSCDNGDNGAAILESLASACEKNVRLNDDVEADEDVCPVCLHTPELVDLAIVKGCGHSYCVHCILHWAVQKEDPWCPKCKAPFEYVLTYRGLDDGLHEYPTAEPVVLLKRTQWFVDHLKVVKGKEVEQPAGPEEVCLWDDYSRYYEEYDEEQDVEDYYYSSAAGRARIVLGNRRWGDGGYVASGRKCARPVSSTPQPSKGAKGNGHCPASSSVPVPRTPVQNERCSPRTSGSVSSQDGVCSTSSKLSKKGKEKERASSGGGRRARRSVRQYTSPGDEPSNAEELY